MLLIPSDSISVTATKTRLFLVTQRMPQTAFVSPLPNAVTVLHGLQDRALSNDGDPQEMLRMAIINSSSSDDHQPWKDTLFVLCAREIIVIVTKEQKRFTRDVYRDGNKGLEQMTRVQMHRSDKQRRAECIAEEPRYTSASTQCSPWPGSRCKSTVENGYCVSQAVL